MSRAVITYAKREMKKLIPVLVLGVGYILFLFFKVYLDVRDFLVDGLLSFSYPGGFEIHHYGDVFLSPMAERMNDFHPVAVLVLEIFLIFRLFYQENRSEISDFLRILPVREWQKIWIKAGAGEILILCISILFGAVGTSFNLVIDSGVQEINSMIRYQSAGESVNSFAGIWVTALLLFLSMSAIFLVLFAAQCCIHSILIGFLTGFGILSAPMYFCSALLGRNYIWIISALMAPYPEWAIGWTTDYAYSEQELLEVHAIWDYLPEKVGFLLIAILAALIVLVAASRLYWHIREVANSIINSKAVMEFILTGLALAVAVGIVVFIDTIPNGTFGFYAVSLLIGGGLLGIFNIIAHLIEKRQKGV